MRVKRAGLDYWKHVSLTVHDSLEAAARTIPGFDQALWFSTHATHDFYDVEIPDPAVLIFGKETRGLGEQLRGQHEDRLVNWRSTASTSAHSTSPTAAVAIYRP